MRGLRKLGLLTLGFFGGFAAAAAMAKWAIPSRGDAESDEIALVAIFGDADRRSRATLFRGGSMLAWFGGINLDLREAKLAPDARLSLHAIFGGISISVPRGWRVESGVRAFAGGVGVSGQQPDDPAAPRLQLDGFALCGGVGVSRKTPSAADEDLG